MYRAKQVHNMKTQVTQKKPSELIPYVNNAKLHSDSQIQKIASSIKEFGFNNPILIDKENGVVAGHGRLAAAQLLKLESVPTICLSYLSELQKKAYILADNRLGEVGTDWDYELVDLELNHLKDNEFEVEQFGFNFGEIEAEADYGLLDDDEYDDKLDEMEGEVKKAIQIEFEQEHYEEAQELIKFWRAQEGYVGLMLINYLRDEKLKL
jgi:ParB-like chromosome segregation protein Spo0J